MKTKLIYIVCSIPFFIFLWLVIYGFSERSAWILADHVTKGTLRIEDYLLNKSISGIGNYRAINEHLQDRLSDPAYTYEQFKEDERGKIAYEIKFTKIAEKIIESYKSSGLIND